MGLASRHAEGEVARTAPNSTSTRAREFDAFAATLRRDLAPTSLLGDVLADRVVLAAWRLHLASIDDTDAARGKARLAPIARDVLRAECSLETALALFETVRRS